MSKYNGWTNYETWRVQLEIIDDYVQNSLCEDYEEYLETSKYNLVEMLKDYADEAITNFGELAEGLALDYARSFLSDVDWYELAEHAIDALKEAKEYASK